MPIHFGRRRKEPNAGAYCFAKEKRCRRSRTTRRRGRAAVVKLIVLSRRELCPLAMPLFMSRRAPELATAMKNSGKLLESNLSLATAAHAVLLPPVPIEAIAVASFQSPVLLPSYLAVQALPKEEGCRPHLATTSLPTHRREGLVSMLPLRRSLGEAPK